MIGKFRICDDYKVPLPLQRISIGRILSEPILYNRPFILPFNQGAEQGYEPYDVFVEKSTQALCARKTVNTLLPLASLEAQQSADNIIGIMAVTILIGGIIPTTETKPLLIADLRYRDLSIPVEDNSKRPDDEELASDYDEDIQDIVEFDGFVSKSDLYFEDDCDGALYGSPIVREQLSLLALKMDEYFADANDDGDGNGGLLLPSQVTGNIYTKPAEEEQPKPAIPPINITLALQ